MIAVCAGAYRERPKHNDKWEDLTAEWDKFLSAAQFDKSSEEVGEAAKQLGLQMKEAYDRFKKALD